MLEECGFPHPRPLPQAGEGKKGKLPGALWIEKFPRPFRWERARERVISLFAGERTLILTAWSSSSVAGVSFPGIPTWESSNSSPSFPHAVGGKPGESDAV